MKGILEVIKLIYGSKALSKILGTRTNVIRLPDNELKQYTKSDLNIEAASDKLAQKAKADMKELLADYPRMNDAEKLIFEGNLRRLGNKLGVTEKGPAADVLEFGTGEKVSPEGIMSLTEKAGQKNPPTTLMGKLESRVKQLEASGKDLETIAKEKGGTDLNDFFSNFAKDQKAMMKLEDQGLVRATAREIINRDIKSGKIKLPKEIEQDMVQGGGEPINVLRQFYGEDALEQLDSMIPELRNFYTAKEAADAVNKKFKFEFKADRLPESISIEDAKKAEQEFNIVPADSEEGKVITEKLIGKPKAPVTELMTAEKIISDMKKMDPMDAMKEANKVLKKEGKYKNLQEKDVERIMEDTNDFIFGRDIPEDPEGFAKGGRVGFNEGSKLTDYLKTNISAKTSSSSPEEGVKVKQEILDGIISLNIPLSKKLKLLGDLKFGKNRAKVDLFELGKKYGIDLGEEVYKDKYFSPGLGAEYTTDEGTKFNLMVNPEDKGGSISVSRSFANGGSTGLDYLMGIERRGYANGDYAVQAGIKNYLGKQKTATVPIKWKSGKDHPDTELAYITKPEKDLLIKLDMHNSMSDGEPNIGPGGLISLNSGGDGGAGGGTSDSGGFDGTESLNDQGFGSMGPQAGDLSYTDYRDEDMGPVGNYTMFDEATAKANLQSVVNNMKAKMTKDMDPLQRAAFNLSINNPFTSTFGKIGNFVLSPIGTILSSFSYNPDFAGDRKYTDYGNTSYFTGDERDGGGGDERKFIPSFDTTLLTPDLDKNRDYRLFQSSNNPFYSMQAVPSGGINNVYTEFKKGGRVRYALGGGFGSVPVDPMEAMYVNTFGFNPFPKYGFNSYMDYNTARTTGTPMNQNISDLEDYLGTLDSAREINLPGVTKDLSTEDISRLQEEYIKEMAKTANALNPTVTASTSTSTPDYRQQALSEMLSRYNVSSLGDIKNFNYLIPGYKDKNNLQVRAFETRIPDLAVSRRAQQLEDAAIRAQQDQEAYKNRISQVDPNALRNSYLQNLQNTSSQSIDQFQSKLRSNLVPRKKAAQGLDYLTGL
jgi:hypothetical protein